MSPYELTYCTFTKSKFPFIMECYDLRSSRCKIKVSVVKMKTIGFHTFYGCVCNKTVFLFFHCARESSAQISKDLNEYHNEIKVQNVSAYFGR